MVKPCPECGDSFTPLTLEIFGRRMFESRYCEPCTERLSTEQDLQKAEAERQERENRRAAWWEALCPALFRDTDPARLPQKALAKALAWQHGPKGLLIYGDSGRGKTRIAYQLLRRLFDEGRYIRVYTATTFRQSATSAALDGTAEEWLEGVCRAEVFYFDDLGQMKLTESSEETLLAVIAGRTDRCMPILATSQYSGDELAAQFIRPNRGQAILRRLREFCEVISV